jgi:SAM-dependent methyltransferase
LNERSFDEADVAASWDRNADLWTQEVRSGFDLYRELYTLPAFQAFMPSIAGKQVIDLGCGEGNNTRLFAKLGGKLTGVDLSVEMIRLARQKEEEQPLSIRYELCSYNDLMFFEDEQFDCALSTMALMDGPDLPAAMRAAHRVLKPGGELCFSILHPCFITPATQWLKDEQGDYSGIRVGRYFQREPFVEHWRFGRRPHTAVLEEYKVPFEVPRFPRTLSDYLNALSAAGFRIRNIDEPRPDEALSRQHEWLNRWYQHAPLVLFVSAIKD